MKKIIIFGLIALLMTVSTVYLMFRFCATIWIILRDRFWPEEAHIELTDAQIVVLKKEFVWKNGEVIVYPMATYLNYTVFKCGQGHTAYVMFRGDKLVDTITFDFEVLIDEEWGVLFKLHNKNLYNGNFYVRRT